MVLVQTFQKLYRFGYTCFNLEVPAHTGHVRGCGKKELDVTRLLHRTCKCLTLSLEFLIVFSIICIRWSCNTVLLVDATLHVFPIPLSFSGSMYRRTSRFRSRRPSSMPETESRRELHSTLEKLDCSISKSAVCVIRRCLL